MQKDPISLISLAVPIYNYLYLQGGSSSEVSSTSSSSSSSAPPAPSSSSASASSRRTTTPLMSSLSRDLASVVPQANACSYAPCFCEENVWKICDHVRTNSPAELPKAFAVFVSNQKQVGGTFRRA